MPGLTINHHEPLRSNGEEPMAETLEELVTGNKPLHEADLLSEEEVTKPNHVPSELAK